jgi:hypothetical protein
MLNFYKILLIFGISRSKVIFTKFFTNIFFNSRDTNLLLISEYINVNVNDKILILLKKKNGY